jgi:hypothetical protein
MRRRELAEQANDFKYHGYLPEEDSEKPDSAAGFYQFGSDP